MAWQPITYRWRWQLKSSPTELWPLVADTQRFNQATGLPVVHFTAVALETGGSRLLAETSKLGISVQYEDYPFDWVKEQQFSNVRVFERGPLAKTVVRVSLEPNEAGTMLHYELEITPANLLGRLGIPYQFGWEMRRNFERIYRQIDQAIQQRTGKPFVMPVKPLSNLAQTRLAKLSEDLITQGSPGEWVEKLAQTITTEPDMNLIRMRPYQLAAVWQAPRGIVLALFLASAKAGLLNMQWDLMCPLCRGTPRSAASLDEVHQEAHCPACNIDFSVNFSQNVELTFQPHPQVRTVSDNRYCVGGPMTTPHILVHQTLAPGETRRIATVDLPPDRYRLRTQRPEVEDWFDLPAEAEGQITIQAEAEAIELSTQYDRRQSGLELVMTNRAAYPQRIYVEQAAWYAEAVTAAYVTSLQHFRDLFSDEVLRPGDEIGIQGMTILFSDLVGSTAMYNQRGDAPSFGVVRDQFSFLEEIVRRYEGAIVKTIGDAIMAVFSDPAQGVAAALAIQQEIATFNTTSSSRLTIKLGLYYGPCIAVNLNGRLDYFGTTVNLAARLEGQSRGGDVVISEKLRYDPAVETLLSNGSVQIEPFETSIKGFDDHFKLYRLQPMSEGEAIMPQIAS